MEEFRWKRCIFYSCHGDSEWFGMIRSDSSSSEDSNKLSAVAFRTECPNQQKIDFKFFNFAAILISQLGNSRKIMRMNHLIELLDFLRAFSWLGPFTFYRLRNTEPSRPSFLNISKSYFRHFYPQTVLTAFELVKNRGDAGICECCPSEGGCQQSFSSLHHVRSLFFFIWFVRSKEI